MRKASNFRVAIFVRPTYGLVVIWIVALGVGLCLGWSGAYFIFHRRSARREAAARMAVEAQLRETTSEYQAVFRALPDLSFRINAKDQIVAYEAGRAADLYVPPSEFLGKTFQDVLPEDASKLIAPAVQRSREQNDLQVVEYPLTFPGETKFFEARILPILEDQLFMLVRDITDRKRNEAQIRASLHEKEVLLKEIQHRVKNNLEIIASLVDLQSNQVGDPIFLDLVSEIRNRVRSISLIHEQLYHSGDLGRIAFDVYVTELTRNLFHSYGIDPSKIRLETDLDPVLLALDAAMPCGLILSELVSNSLKHAFTPGKSGVVRVRLKKSAGEVELVIEDTGRGLGTAQPGKTLGLQLVDTLARQLGGVPEFRSTEGLTVRICFPYRDRTEVRHAGADSRR